MVVYRPRSTKDRAISKLNIPVERTNLRKLVHERVRQAILNGELAPGERFTETQLAEGLGTSRAPVREALRELEQESLIVPSGQRGYELRPVTPRDVEELCLLRVALERLAASMFSTRADDRDLARLQGIVDDMKTLDDKPRSQRRRDELDAEFHQQLVIASQHELLLRTWLTMRDRLTLAMRAVNLAWPVSPGFVQSHQKVVDALASGDPEKAQLAIERHIQDGVQKLLRESDAATP